MQSPDDLKYWAACIAGGAAASVVNKSTDTRWRKCSEAFVGVLSALFCGPSIARATGISEVADIMALGFITAVCGYGILTAIVDWAKGATVRDWLTRFIGPKSPKSDD